MDKNLFRLLRKYLAGNVTNKDREKISNWYDNLGAAEAGFKNSFVKKKVRDSLWANIQAKIRKSASVIFSHYRMVAAAVLLILSTPFLCIYYKNHNPHGQMVRSALTAPETEIKDTALMNSV